jgi:hypothetical protein
MLDHEGLNPSLGAKTKPIYAYDFNTKELIAKFRGQRPLSLEVNKLEVIYNMHLI